MSIGDLLYLFVGVHCVKQTSAHWPKLKDAIRDMNDSDCYLRQVAGGMKIARNGSRTCFLR